MIASQRPGGPRTPASGAEWWRDPRAGLLVGSVAAVALGAASAVSSTVASIALVAMVTIIVVWWATTRGDALVVAVALLVFWAPFHTTLSQFNISPQEVGVYFTLLGCVMLDRRGVIRWLRSFFVSVPRVSLIAIAVFGLACVQSVALESGVGALGRVQALRAAFLYPVLFAMLVTYTIRTRQAERWLIQSFYAGAVALAVYALALKVTGAPIGNGAVIGRLGAEVSVLSQYHPNNIGLYMALALPFAVPLWMEIQLSTAFATLKKAGLLLSVTLLALDIVLAASRGTLVALAASALVAVITLMWLGTAAQRAIVGSILLGGLAGALALALGRQTAAFGRYTALFSPTELISNPNVQFRLALYKRAWVIVKGRPLTGIGLQAFATTGSTPFSPHDTYLDLWVSIGLLGALAFVFVLIHGIWSALAWARYHRKSGRQLGMFYSLGVILGLVTFITQAFVEAYDAQPRIAPIVWMLALAAQIAAFRVVPARLTAAPAPALGRNLAELPPTASAPTASAGQADAQNQEAAGPAALDPSESAPAQADPARISAHPPLPPPITPHNAQAPDSPMPAPPSLRRWAARRRTPAVAEGSALAGGQRVMEEVDPSWDWNLQTGPLVAMAEVTLPLIEESAFASSNITEATAFRQTAIARAVGGAAPAPPVADVAIPARSSAAAADGDHADELLRRAPGGYLWNQVYSILIFGLSFALSVIIARGLSAADFGVYTLLSSLVSVLLLLFAFGLEDAAAVFVPRALASAGRGGAASFLRQMLIARALIMLVIGALLAVGLPLVAGPMQSAGLAPKDFAHTVAGYGGLRAALMGAYLAGSAIIALQGAFFASVLKTRATLVIGGVAQLAGAALTFALIWLGYGIDGVFAAQALASWCAVIAFLIVLRPYLVGRGRAITLADGQVRSLALSAWLTNVSNGALGKQMDIMIMSLFAVSYAAIGFYNLAYQMVTIIGVLLISGLGGVSVAAMSVAYSARGPGRLISLWRAIIMLQLLLVIPLQILTFLLADQIITTIYGVQYAPAATLLRIFLIFSFLGRLLGGGANQSALYVVNKQRVVLMTRWIGFAINLALDVILIRLAGPAGAMLATGFSQLWVGLVEFLVLRRELKNTYPVSMAIRVVLYSLVAAIPVTALMINGLAGLMSKSVIYVLVFVAGAWLFQLGDTKDIVDLATLNPRINWMIQFIGRLSVGRVWRGKQIV